MPFDGKLNIEAVKTYYIYDDFGLLRFVIPPEASKLIENGNTFSDVSNDYCYSYKYDGRHRMTEKNFPVPSPFTWFTTTEIY